MALGRRGLHAVREQQRDRPAVLRVRAGERGRRRGGRAGAGSGGRGGLRGAADRRRPDTADAGPRARQRRLLPEQHMKHGDRGLTTHLSQALARRVRPDLAAHRHVQDARVVAVQERLRGSKET